MRYIIIIALALLFVSNSWAQVTSSGLGTGDWNDPASWNPVGVPDVTSDAITILSGHTITVTDTQDADEFTIQSGGTLVIDATGDLTIQNGSGNDIDIQGTVTNNGALTVLSGGFMNVDGILENSGTVMNSGGASQITFNSGATYDHQFTTTAGIIPLATWSPGSTCLISGYTSNTSAPSNLAQDFYNFTYNCTGQLGNVNFNAGLTSILNNLTVSSTGGDPNKLILVKNENNVTIDIGGGFFIQNDAGVEVPLNGNNCVINITGAFNHTSTSNSVFAGQGDITLNVNGNFVCTQGRLRFGTGADGDAFINVIGNFTFSGGEIARNGSSTSVGTIISFAGSSEQVYSDGGVYLGGVDFVVKNGSIVNLRADNLSGSGDFTLESEGTILVGGGNGISAGTRAGNIRVSGTRTYEANSNIVYNGTVTQNMGSEWGTGVLATSPVNLTIENSNGVNNNNTSSSILVDDFILTQGTFDLGTTTTLTVQGNWVNNGGSLTYADKAVSFEGASSQTISGSASTDFYSISVADGSSVSLDATANLFGTLTLNGSGSFDADGSGSGDLTIKSTDLTNDGGIAELTTPANFTGDVTVERFIDGRTGGDWRYISVPVTGANLGMWRDDFPVTGNFSDASPNGVNNVIDNTAASVYYYDSGTDAWVAVDGGGGTTSTVSLSNGVGYSVYTFLDADHKAIVRGPIGKGTMNLSISGVSGRFNLMGNPYPSTLDGNTMLDNNPNVNSTFYIRTDNNTFASYNAAVDAGAGHPNGSWAGEIFMGQSFWVVSESTSTLNITESMKTGTGNGQFLKKGDSREQSLLRVVLAGETQSDEAVIVFKDGATAGREHFDGVKLLNGNYNSKTKRRTYINLSSYNDENPDLRYVFNVLDNKSCIQNVKLKVEDVPIGNYKLKFDDSSEMYLPYKITLVDNFTDQQIAIEANSQYEFEVTSDNLSKGSNRFEILFEANIVDKARDLDFDIINTCDVPYTEITVDNTQVGIDYLLTLGENVYDSVRASSANTSLYIDNQNLSAGVNLFSVKAVSPFACEDNQYIYENAIAIDYDPIPVITSVEGDVNCPGGSFDLSASGAPENGSYNWYESFEADEPISDENGNHLIINELYESKIYYVAAVNSKGCEGDKTAIYAEVDQPTEPSVINGAGCAGSNIQLTASGASGDDYYRWYDSEGGDPIEGVNSNVFITETLEENTQFFVAIASKGNCESERVPVLAEIINVKKPEIETQGNTLLAPEAEEYIWYRNGEIIEGALSRSFEVTSSGKYSVEIRLNDCSAVSDEVVMKVTSINDDFTNIGISVYPNPVDKELRVYLKDDLTIKDVDFNLYDISGNRIVSKKDFHYLNGYFTSDVAYLREGIYILSVKYCDNYFSVKILK